MAEINTAKINQSIVPSEQTGKSANWFMYSMSTMFSEGRQLQK